ncbi:hypothetical protein SOM12_12310 [Flavobacterium sp. CFBP9031]|uniref:hypothetical protein n=1 Tax=Flavobacterium sp. CFBP9031 TaxID=3096538 RepID=UPI002A6B6253|nr:hypothetical protein [Flavobacterium sp. CFBP9031]MDY0988200.1 hypothetical protein [Flavobacterium sp. CFBP9031]
MRNITRSYLLVDIPDKLKEAATLNLVENIAASADTSLIISGIYRDPYNAGIDKGIQSRIIDKLNHWYFNKCAYCERIYVLDVEHYRPKGEIRGLNNELIRNNGYYWLGYEWSNLIPACITCNRQGGKVSKFPYLVGGVQIVNPTFVGGFLDKNLCKINSNESLAEKPLMLHPETETNFLDFFSFTVDADLAGITIVGIDAEERGNGTINICNLNRYETRKDRVQSVIKDFISSNKVIVEKLNLRSIDEPIFKIMLENNIQKLYNDCNDVELAHTLLRKFIVSSPANFNNIILPFTDNNFKLILSTAFANYIPT